MMASDAPSPQGLSSAVAAQRLAEDGPNLLEVGKKRALALQVLVRFKNPLVILLLVACTLEAVTGDFVSATIIIVLVVLSVTLDFVQEHRADHAASALRKA